MLTLSPAVRIYLATGATDLRRSIDGLAAVVRDQFTLDPLSGHLFLFRNRRGDRLKILAWESSGFWNTSMGSLLIWHRCQVEETTRIMPRHLPPDSPTPHTSAGTMNRRGISVDADSRAENQLRVVAVGRKNWLFGQHGRCSSRRAAVFAGPELQARRRAAVRLSQRRPAARRHAPAAA